MGFLRSMIKDGDNERGAKEGFGARQENGDRGWASVLHENRTRVQLISKKGDQRWKAAISSED